MSLLRAWLLALALLPLGCSDDPQETGENGGSATQGEPRQPPLRPAASCPVVIEAPAFLPARHVPEGTALEYNSNPPSSGPHYPVWANFQEYARPVEWPYLVHTIEHGAVLLLYKCDDASTCPAVAESLRRVRDAAPTDARCHPSIRVRVVIAPEPRLDAPIAAAAWGFTYKADCVDAPTLSAFLGDHYAQGPEDICDPGRSF